MPDPGQPPPAEYGGFQSFRYGQPRKRPRPQRAANDTGLYFVTLFLSDSLPKALIQKIAARAQLLVTAQSSETPLTPEQAAQLAECAPRQIEEQLDRGEGSCSLADPRLSAATAAALRSRHGQHYRLLAWCILPNHVHAVLRLAPGRDLAKVLRAWKLASEKAARHALGIKGRFWRKESFTHMLRDQPECRRAIRYVLENPAKAGLKDWIWLWSGDGEGHS